MCNVCQAVEAMTDVRCSFACSLFLVRPVRVPLSCDKSTDHPTESEEADRERKIVSNTCLVNRQSRCLKVCKHCTGINATISEAEAEGNQCLCKITVLLQLHQQHPEEVAESIVQSRSLFLSNMRFTPLPPTLLSMRYYYQVICK